MMSDHTVLSEDTPKKQSRTKRLWSSLRIRRTRFFMQGDMAGNESLANGAAPADCVSRKRKIRRSRSLIERTSHAISSLVRGVTGKRTRPTPHQSPEGSGFQREEALSPELSTWLLVEPVDNGIRTMQRADHPVTSADGQSDGVFAHSPPVHHSALRRRSSAPPSESIERTPLRPNYASSPAGSPRQNRRLVPAHNQHTHHGSKQAGTGRMAKKWRGKQKGSPATPSPGQLCLWSPSPDEEHELCEWQSLSGRSVTLVDIDVCLLSGPERKILQKVALAKLAAFNLGVALSIPKERDRGLKRTLSFRSHGKLGEEKEKEQSPGPRAVRGCTFGLPLAEVIRNDLQMEKFRLPEPKLLGTPGDVPRSLVSSSESLDDSPHHSSSNLMSDGNQATTPASIGGEFLTSVHDHTSLRKLHQLTNSELNLHSSSESNRIPPEVTPRCYSLSITPGGGYTLTPRRPLNRLSPALQRNRLGVSPSPIPDMTDASSREDLSGFGRTFSANDLLEPLPNPFAGGTSSGQKKRKKQREKPNLNDLLAPPPKRVPVLVTEAIQFLREHGLHHVGLFRIAGSKRRCRQIREEIDTGYEIKFTPEIHSAHDIASLLKNFLRDLPEPLLTRELYPAFTATVRLDTKEQQVAALQLLCCMLPATHRDTLREVLMFAKEVSEHAEDRVIDGNEVPGNKMDIANMALVLGPNILRSHKGKAGMNFKVIKQQHADQQEDISYVVTQLIEHERTLFQVGKELHHKVMLVLLDKHPPMVDFLLKKKCIDLGLVSAVELPLVDYPLQVEGSGNLSADDIIGTDQKWERTKSNPAMVRRARHYSNPVTMDDFAKKNPSTGRIVPTWAAAGDVPENEEVKNGELANEGAGTTENFQEVLAMVVQELENWYCATPEPVKHHASSPPSNAPPCNPTSVGFEHVLAEAVIGTWKERSPRQHRIRLRRSSSALCRLENENDTSVSKLSPLQRNFSLGAHDCRHDGQHGSSSEQAAAIATAPQSSGEATPTTSITPTASNRQPKLSDKDPEMAQRPASSSRAPGVLVTCPSEEASDDVISPRHDYGIKPHGRQNVPFSWPSTSQEEAYTAIDIFTGPVPEYGRWQNPQLRRYTVRYLRQYFERLARSQKEQLPAPCRKTQRAKLTDLHLDMEMTASDSSGLSNTSVYSGAAEACSNSTAFSPTSTSQGSEMVVATSNNSVQQSQRTSCTSEILGSADRRHSNFSCPSSCSSSCSSDELSVPVFDDQILAEPDPLCSYQAQKSNDDVIHADVETTHHQATETIV